MEQRVIKANEMLFRRLAPEDVVIRSIDEKTRTIWHPVTREVNDRMGDIVRLGGANLEEFKKKPGVLYGHDYRSMNPIPVIAENVGFQVEGDRLIAGTRFLDTGTPGMSQPLKDLVNDNWILQSQKLLGWSIGFMPTKWEAIKNTDGQVTGFDFQEWKLYEYSSVIIPAHQDAVNDAIKGGQITGAVKKYFDMLPAIKSEPEPEAKGVIPYASHGTAPEGEAWDAGAEVGKADVNQLKKMCAWFDSANPDVKGSYKLPHHKAGDLKAVWRGVAAAMGALLGARGGVNIPDADRKGVYNHLSKHYDEFSKTPPEFKEYEDEGEEFIEPEPQVAAPGAVEDIPKEEPKSQGGNKVLDKIFDKLNKGEPLTSDEKEVLAKFRLALMPEKAAEPIRKLELTDEPRRADVRPISKFYGEQRGDLFVPPDDPKTYTSAEKELVDFLDKAYIVGEILHKPASQLKMWTNFFDRNSSLKKALAEATSSGGAEWVPTLLSANLYQLFFLNAIVASLFQEIPMPGNPYTLPYSFDTDAADGFYYVAESTSDEPGKSPTSNVTTGKLTLTARKLKRRILFSEELQEDSIVPVISVLQNQIVMAAARAIDNAVINGDTTATHQDSNVTDPRDVQKAWIGLRKSCQAGQKVDCSTFNTSNLMSIRTAMSKWGMDPSQLAWIPGPKTYNKMLGLTEVLTVDKFGPSAVIIKGELAALLGVPIVPSEKVKENLNASGVYDGTTTTKTIGLIVNRLGFIVGTRGTARVRMEEEGATDINQLTVSFRKAFTAVYDTSSYPTVGLAYNIS